MSLKGQRIAYLRALAINTLINEAVQIFIENDCRKKFKFTPTSTGSIKDRLVKRIQYIKK